MAETNTGVILGVDHRLSAFPFGWRMSGFSADAGIEPGGSPSFYAVRAVPCGSAWLIVRCLIRLFSLCWIGGSTVGCLIRLFLLCLIGGSTARRLSQPGGLGPGPHSSCATSLSQLVCSRGLGWLYAFASMCCFPLRTMPVGILLLVH